MPVCETVLHKYKQKDEHKHVNIEQFVRECLVPILGNYSQGEYNSTVMMGICLMHLDRVRELTERADATFLFSDYSSELIPIEAMFR
jgi:hypothetical protein